MRSRVRFATLFVCSLLAVTAVGAEGERSAEEDVAARSETTVEGPRSRSDVAARIAVIRPKEGRTEEFEEGYRRHLRWHRDHADPWTWYGWTFIGGERLGYLLDGTFGHTWSELDHAVDPAGDAADNAANVTPHAEFVSHGVYELLDGVSHAGVPDDTPFLELVTYRVRPGRERDFEELVRRAARIRMDSGSSGREPRRHAWYRLVSGGTVGEYLLMRPRRRLSDLGDGAGFFRVLDDRSPDAAESKAERSIADAIASASSELLRFRRDLSYVPETVQEDGANE